MDTGNKGTATPVLLNVYDLTPANDYLYWLGFGVFHSGIEVHGMEYGFGAHDFPSSGVFEVESKSCPGFIYRKTVWLGTTDMSHGEYRSFIEKLAGKYHGNSYHLVSKNCNHFTDDVCSFFDCLLPESVQVSPVGRVPTLRPVADDDLDSISTVSDNNEEDKHLLPAVSDNNEEDKHLLPAPSNDLHSVDVPLKLAKDVL
uniref:PPPDE domain-containing protein n=3 Tax=Oryza TaxID=4527 RepID=A0A0E0NIM9_ORYRU